MTAPVSDFDSSTLHIVQAEDIPPVDPPEASRIAAAELERLLALLEQLEGDDWSRPTDCTEWAVKDMAAHLAGSCAGWARWRQFFRQVIFNPYNREMDAPVNAINRRQVEDRAGCTPQELIAELRETGPKAIQTRKKLPGVLRSIRISAKPMPGKITMGYLVDIIYPRDEWMHRMDICRATGKPLQVTPAHDGRLLDLVMLDIARTLAGGLAVTVHVTGPLTAAYRFGRGDAQAALTIDLRTLNRRSSQRCTADEALQTAQVEGDPDVARAFLERCEVLY